MFVYESKQIDTEAVLTKISKWWIKESKEGTEYNKSYPDGLGLKNIGDQEESNVNQTGSSYYY